MDSLTDEQYYADVNYYAGVTVDADRRNAVELEARGWEAWCRELYPYLFDRPFTGYQKDFWEWGWTIKPGVYQRPRVECEPRGVGKSTNAEALVVNLIARKKRRMVGYVSLNEQKAVKHFESIRAMLESEALLKYYPHCRPKIQKLRDTASQWSRDAIVTASDAMVVPMTLLGSSRGWKSSTGARFDLIILDDIDELGQSADFTKKLVEMLKGEILAAGDNNTIILMPQNLIYRDSICSQVLDHRADILSDRIFCGPFPLLKWYDAQKIDVPGDTTGAKEWKITAGEPFDEAIDIPYAERLLNKFGKMTFDRECQQKVFEVEDDKDFREWSEVYHLITESEFRATMAHYQEPVWNVQRNCLQIPQRWNVGLGFDWGTTREHPSAVAFTARPSELSPLKDCHFVFAEFIKPEFPLDSFSEPELVSPGRVALGVQNVLKQWNVVDSQINFKLMSHEASAALNTMAVDLKDDIKQFWGKWKARKGSGIPQIQNLLEVDHSKEHPFRRYPKGYKVNGIDVGGQPIQGRPRLFFIVADGQGELSADMTGNLYVVGARDAKGFARARFEMPLYSYRNSGQNKIDDDFVDAFRGIMNIFGANPDELTSTEIVERAMPQEYKISEMLKKTGRKHLTDSQQIARDLMESEVRERLNIPYEDEWLNSGLSRVEREGGY